MSLVAEYWMLICALLLQRIFRYGTQTEYIMQFIATLCALGSGVGMAMVNLVFGQFITVILDYTSGASSPSEFRSGSARLA